MTDWATMITWAPGPLAEGVSRTTFEWGRIQSPLDVFLVVVAGVAVMLFVRWMYRRDAQELPPVWSWLLTALRTLTFYGLLILYLEPQLRNEQEVTRNSRVLVLADTSLSMSLADAGPTSSAGPVSRAGQVADVLANTDFLSRLRRTHDVVVARFDQELTRITSLPKQPAGSSGPAGDSRAGGESGGGSSGVAARPAADQAINWEKALTPTGTETRLGQALRQFILDEQNAPLSGVVVFTDGGQNAGPSPESAIQAARDARVPVFPIGIGSDRQPAHARVSDLAAPPQAYPGDRYTVTGYIQAQKMAGRTITVELLSRAVAGSGNAAAEPDRIEATQQATLEADGKLLPVKFEITPEATGHRMLTFRMRGAGIDPKADDSQREADVNIVDRKNHVLLLASGPSRDYTFLRSLLFRDHSTTVDVLLQTAKPGISQEAAKILDDFPATTQEMFTYDCVVGIDPDWQAIGVKLLALLERWVDKEGGGLVVEAGAVQAGRTLNGWVQDPAMEIVRGLYPVEFLRSVAVVESNFYSSPDAWSLDFTREGLQAEYLWLEDSAAASEATWTSFPGVYSYLPIRGPKPAATVLARFSDPRTSQSGRQPAYFATQPYGSGRVFYIGSPEMWRLRRIDESYFERFYTKLIRDVSQGRLLRGSSRGVLRVAQDRGYMVGNTVEVQAQLKNARHEPLVLSSVPLQVIQRDGSTQTVPLRPEAGRPGSFAGHFTALREGNYRLELTIPETTGERLVRYLQVELPKLETQDPQRNDALLNRMATASGGHYYVGPEPAIEAGDPGAIYPLLKDKTRTTILTAAMDKTWEENWMRWMMYTLSGLLCLEWLIRRLHKLA